MMSKHSIRNHAVVALLWVTLSISIHAEEGRVAMDPPQGWVLEQPVQGAGSEIVFLPPKGRDACFIISQVQKFSPSVDKEKYLSYQHALWFKGQRKKAPERDNIEKFSTDSGDYLISIYEDPKLVGKPVVPGDYKFTIHITGIVDGKRLVICALLTHERDGKDLEEVKKGLGKLKAT